MSKVDLQTIITVNTTLSFDEAEIRALDTLNNYHIDDVIASLRKAFRLDAIDERGIRTLLAKVKQPFRDAIRRANKAREIIAISDREEFERLEAHRAAEAARKNPPAPAAGKGTGPND